MFEIEADSVGTCNEDWTLGVFDGGVNRDDSSTEHMFTR